MEKGFGKRLSRNKREKKRGIEAFRCFRQLEETRRVRGGGFKFPFFLSQLSPPSHLFSSWNFYTHRCTLEDIYSYKRERNLPDRPFIIVLLSLIFNLSLHELPKLCELKS